MVSIDEMKDRISEAAETAVPDIDLTFRPMFGGVCAYVGGRVFASLSNIGLGLKLAPSAQDDLLAEPGAKRLRYEPDAPESKQYIVIPESAVSDAETLAPWVKRSVEYVLTLPAPKPKRAKSKE